MGKGELRKQQPRKTRKNEQKARPVDKVPFPPKPNRFYVQKHRGSTRNKEKKRKEEESNAHKKRTWAQPLNFPTEGPGNSKKLLNITPRTNKCEIFAGGR